MSILLQHTAQDAPGLLVDPGSTTIGSAQTVSTDAVKTNVYTDGTTKYFSGSIESIINIDGWFPAGTGGGNNTYAPHLADWTVWQSMTSDWNGNFGGLQINLQYTTEVPGDPGNPDIYAMEWSVSVSSNFDSITFSHGGSDGVLRVFSDIGLTNDISEDNTFISSALAATGFSDWNGIQIMIVNDTSVGSNGSCSAYLIHPSDGIYTIGTVYYGTTNDGFYDDNAELDNADDFSYNAHNQNGPIEARVYDHAVVNKSTYIQARLQYHDVPYNPGGGPTEDEERRSLYYFHSSPRSD